VAWLLSGSLAEIGMSPTTAGTTNDHESTIKRIVDKLSAEGRLSPSTIDEIIAALDFVLTVSETKFLVAYLRWRMDSPIDK
jgi:hypothetical protein